MSQPWFEGSPPPPPPPPGAWYPPTYQPRQTNSMAIAALVSALFLAPLGIVLGHIALSQIKRSGEEGRGLALAGLILGYVLTGFMLLFFLFYLVAIIWIFNTVPDHYHDTNYGSYSMAITTGS